MGKEGDKGGRTRTIQTGILAGVMIIAGILAVVLVPRSGVSGPAPDFDTLLPSAFAGWHVRPGIQQVTAQEPDSLERELYSRVTAQSYDDGAHVVMLLLAYGPNQTDRLQLHRPEICYVANGFRVSDVKQASIALDSGKLLPVKRLVASREGRTEYITYWMRIGNQVANSVWQRQLLKVEYGLRGSIPDGLLVRTSVVGNSPQDAYAVQDRFIKSLIQIAPQIRRQMIGQANVS